ncbi:MAG TPA: TonB-dependent receptor [Blastocatellia bacterium]|nr:TonB-dependent receptor [Blastocatellia bacterium]
MLIVHPVARKAPSSLLVALIFLLTCGIAIARSASSVSGVVRDSSEAAVADASVSLLSAQQVTVGTTRTDSQGKFSFPAIPSGQYLLVVKSRGFGDRQQAVTVGSANLENLEVRLDPSLVNEEVTVTTNPGMVESAGTVSQQVNVISEHQIEERTKSVTAQIANEEVGVHLQRTASVMSGIFVRGVTGNKVNIFIDGFRYSNAGQRGGVNTFLNLIDSTSLRGVEILRGPNSAQYGSDALGGSIQFLTSNPYFSANGSEVHGKMGTFFNSADASFGSNLLTTYATRNFGFLLNVSGRRVNNIRTGHERDSHNAVTRFLGLSSDLVIDGRLTDTAFTQYGGYSKMNWAPTAGSQISASYMRGQQDGGKRFDQLLGGDGNLIADLRNLMLDFATIRYDSVNAGWFDTLTIGYSFNSQREERVNQGGNGNPNASINHEGERTSVNGIHGFLGKQWGARNNFLVGGDFYNERVTHAQSYGFNPVTGVAALRRGRVPNNAHFKSGGIYAQDVFNVVPSKLRLVGNIRYSAASYEARAADSPLVGGKPLWPDDSLDVDDVTFRAGIVGTPVTGLSLSANFSRGFRAPHITDLGTLGLTGSGFEVAAPDVAGLGGTVGSAAGSTAVSTGRPVAQVGPEISMNYEIGIAYRNRRFETNFAWFVNDIDDNIVKQALILPPGAVGTSLGGTPITSQGPTGVVFVAASTNPVLVRANFDDARIFGIEHTLDVKMNRDWSLGTIFTYLHARDKRTDLPPNIEGGTPAPDGYLKIRYAPVGKRFWIEPYVHMADRQERLSTLDLDDRRTGGGRSRGAIANFFNNGARFLGLVNSGPDGVRGNADDRLVPTGETLAQVQNRVLGVGVNSAPLYTAVPGYVVFSVRGGIRWGERHELLLDFDNIGDRNYRGISWGVDAPGRGIFMKYNLRF